MKASNLETQLLKSLGDLNSRIFSSVETGLRDIQASQDIWNAAGSLLQIRKYPEFTER
jgi:hypothetical protein